MLLQWFAQPLPIMAIELAGALGVFALLLAWLSFYSPVKAFVQSYTGVVPAFVNIAALMFGLLTTFLAQDIWEANRQAERAIGQEREQLLTLRALGEIDGRRDGGLRSKIRDYVETTVGLEWKAMEHGEDAPEAENALDALTRFAVQSGADAGLQRAMIDATLRLRAARAQRLAIAHAFSDVEKRKWLAVILLAFVTQIGLAVAHLERARPQLIAQLIFIAAASVSVSLIGSVEAPFMPPNSISDQSLSEVIERVGDQSPPEIIGLAGER